MSYRVSYSSQGDVRTMTIFASSKAELARGIKELTRAWGEDLSFPKFTRKAGEFFTGLTWLSE